MRLPKVGQPKPEIISKPNQLSQGTQCPHVYIYAFTSHRTGPPCPYCPYPPSLGSAAGRTWSAFLFPSRHTWPELRVTRQDSMSAFARAVRHASSSVSVARQTSCRRCWLRRSPLPPRRLGYLVDAEVQRMCRILQSSLKIPPMLQHHSHHVDIADARETVILNVVGVELRALLQGHPSPARGASGCRH